MTIRQWLLIQPILEFLVSMIHIRKETFQLLHPGKKYSLRKNWFALNFGIGLHMQNSVAKLIANLQRVCRFGFLKVIRI